MTARPEDDPVTDGAVLGDRRQEDEGMGHETSSQGWHCLREGGRKAGDQRDGTDTWILGGMGLSDDMGTPCVTWPSARRPVSYGTDRNRRVLHKECYNGMLQLRSSLCNTVQNVRQSGL